MQQPSVKRSRDDLQPSPFTPKPRLDYLTPAQPSNLAKGVHSAPTEAR